MVGVVEILFTQVIYYIPMSRGERDPLGGRDRLGDLLVPVLGVGKTGVKSDLGPPDLGVSSNKCSAKMYVELSKLG
jgi:hypothetical protein